MEVHLMHKWMKIAFLQGVVPELPEVLVLHLCSMVEPQQSAGVVINVPKEISKLLSEFESVFAPISTLPPERACDHSIPLIAGAKPVYIIGEDTITVGIPIRISVCSNLYF
jgi:hypothetical protein